MSAEYLFPNSAGFSTWEATVGCRQHFSNLSSRAKSRDLLLPAVLVTLPLSGSPAPNSRSFDCKNGLASESVLYAQDDRIGSARRQTRYKKNGDSFESPLSFTNDQQLEVNLHSQLHQPARIHTLYLPEGSALNIAVNARERTGGIAELGMVEQVVSL